MFCHNITILCLLKSIITRSYGLVHDYINEVNSRALKVLFLICCYFWTWKTALLSLSDRPLGEKAGRLLPRCQILEGKRLEGNSVSAHKYSGMYETT